VPGYAIAYTPKDPPSTPAVVIAPEAQSSPENPPPESKPAPKKREFSQTIPSRVRSAPSASVAPLPPPVALDDFNPYAPKKSNGKVIGLVLGGALLLLVSVVGVRSLSGGSHEPPAQSAHPDVVPAATVVAAAPTPAPAEATLTARANPTLAAASSPESAPATRHASEPALSPAKVKAKTKAKAKAEPAAAAARPVARAPEPSPPATKAASKGVIVRDAPF